MWGFTNIGDSEHPHLNRRILLSQGPLEGTPNIVHPPMSGPFFFFRGLRGYEPVEILN